MRVFILVLISLTFCFANKQDIADAIKDVSNKSGVDARIYYSIIEIESGFRPYSLSMVANEKMLEATKKLPKENFIVKSSPYNNKYLISVFSYNENDIVELAKVLYKLDLNIDMGLMQISKQHVSEDEIERIFNPRYNIIKGNNVLADCANRYKTLAQSIECYNRGFINKKTLTYYKKFVNSFNNNFGDTHKWIYL